MDTLSDNLRDVLLRHEAFWQCDETERPLIGITRWPYIPLQAFDYGFSFEEGILHPEMLVVDHFLPQYEAYYETYGLLDGDLFWWATLPGAMPWLEAIVGCPVRYSEKAGSLCAEPVIFDWGYMSLPDPVSDSPSFAEGTCYPFRIIN